MLRNARTYQISPLCLVTVYYIWEYISDEFVTSEAMCFDIRHRVAEIQYIPDSEISSASSLKPNITIPYPP